jgi:glutamate dehydrogenase
VVSRFGDLIGRHRLYPQLAATRVAHEVVDRMGVTWANETAEELGVGLADVGGAYWAARQVRGAPLRWQEVEKVAAVVAAEAEEALDLAVAEAVQNLARRYLVDGDKDVAQDRVVADRLAAAAMSADGEARAKRLVEMGIPPVPAQSFGRLATVALAADVGMVIRTLGVAAEAALAVVEAFEAFDTALGLVGFREALSRLAVTSRWGRWQVRRLEDDLADLRRQGVMAALGSKSALGDPAAAMTALLAERVDPKARFQRLAAHLGDPESDGPSVAALAVRALRELVASQ